ncbi:50S ribosomal protein L21 [soil metagenome]
MYAVIRAGGKQFKVAPGDVIEVERLRDGSDTVRFSPLLVVDDDGKASAERGDLDKASVTAKVLGEVKGPKVHVYKFRNKTGYRRHTGHRQRYTSIQISDIRLDEENKKSSNESRGVKRDGA